MATKLEKYFGTEKGKLGVPANANLFGFVVVNDRLKRRKNDKIPFQYVEKMPAFQKEANYEDNPVIGRFEPLQTYSSSTAGQFEIVLLYVAEATRPKPVTQKTLEKELKKDIASYNNKKLKESFAAENLFTLTPNQQFDLLNLYDVKNNTASVVENFSKETDAYARKRYKEYTNIIDNPKGPPKTAWTLEYIESLVLKLKSLVYPQYDGRFSPPNKVLFNAGDLYVDYPLIVKSINIEYDGAFQTSNMMPMMYKITLSCITNYPLYQAISATRIYSGVEGNRIFAQKRFSTMNSSILTNNNF